MNFHNIDYAFYLQRQPNGLRIRRAEQDGASSISIIALFCAGDARETKPAVFFAAG